MMPLSTSDVQVIKLLNAPKLPASLFENAQPLPIRVLSVDNNQATILLAGRQLQTQTTVPLAVGQQLTAQPEMVDGQLQLKLIPNNDPTLSSKLGKLTTAGQINSQANNNSLNTDTKLPSWTDLLPASAKEALGSLKNSLPTQTSLKDLLGTLSQTLPSLLTSTNDGKLVISTAWQSFIKAALTTTPIPSAEKVQQSVIAFNGTLNNKTEADWKKDLITLINDPKSPLVEKQIAQGILAKSEQTQQIQNLHQMAGQAVLLQEIPINTAQGLDNFTLEIDIPKPDTPEKEQQWKIFIQLELPQGDFTSRIQMDKDFNVRLQLWGSSEELSASLQTQAANLKSALQEQGLIVESLIIAQGKPQSRTEQPPWQQPLVDIHS